MKISYKIKIEINSLFCNTTPSLSLIPRPLRPLSSSYYSARNTGHVPLGPIVHPIPLLHTVYLYRKNKYFGQNIYCWKIFIWIT